MRARFVQTLCELAEKSDDLVLITGDLGFGVFDQFQSRFPSNFLNVGITEQSMLGIAAGVALTGKTVFVYSIANFPTLRALEQIRNDVAYHNLSVVIVSVGAGLSYGPMGYSHHAVEDIAVMRAFPNITIYSPADDIETEMVVRHSFKGATPAYIRLSKESNHVLHTKSPPPGQLVVRLSETGRRVLVLSTGSVSLVARDALNALQKEGKSGWTHYSVACLSKLAIDRAELLSYGVIVTIEEHSVRGGLGTLALETIAAYGGAKPILRIGIETPSMRGTGSHDYLMALHGLDQQSLEDKIGSLL